MLLTYLEKCEIMDNVAKEKFIYMKNDQNQNIPWWQPGMQLFAKLSGWIGGPIIIAVFVGKFLDRKYGTEPWLFLATVGISFVISMVMLIKIGFEEFKKIETESKK
jgi:F0F1-type ATP synthase assembly protein I